MNNTINTSGLFQTPSQDNVVFTFVASDPFTVPDQANVIFSFEDPDDLNFIFSDELYKPPLFLYTDFGFDGSEPYIPAGVYDPPQYKFVDFKLDGKRYTSPNGDNTNFELTYIPDCPPDWTETQPLAAIINFEPCDVRPDGIITDAQAAIINFACCKKECEPDWVEQNGGSVIIDIDSCSGDPDFTEQSGASVIIDIDCCKDDVPTPDPVFANGDLRFTFELSGVAIHDQRFVADGDLKLDPVILTGSADRGAQVIGDLRFGEVIVHGEALHAAEVYLVNGDLKLNMTLKGVAEHHEPREAYGDIQFPFVGVGEALFVPVVQDSNIPFELTLEGDANFQIVEVQPSNLKFDDVTIQGVATYNIVPTGSGRLVLDLPMQGDALYVDLPTAWGDLQLDITMQAGSNTTPGAHVYWTNLDLKMQVEGNAVTPILVEESDIQIGDIIIDSTVIAAAIEMASDVHIGEIVFNRGWVEFGDPIPPVIREIYEASNVRSGAIPEYPVEAKYPIYVPTTDYSITDVQLRRGTLDYTLEFNFDAMQVEKVVVWIMDENGNAVIDQVAKWLHGDVKNHVLNKPFKYVLSIPVHCVNDKKYEFYLEVVYDEGDHGDTVTRPRKSFFVPFQAHFDNRDPYFNATDRATSLDAIYDSNLMLQTEFTDFSPNTYAFEESEKCHLSNGLNFDTISGQYYELTQIEWKVSETGNTGFGVNHNEFAHKYYELDIGQIGG